uniref:Uncharacterized protein n=1 Tax=Anguilla anguilla TaxID=7936 RepID=A0A0E9ULI4_ANGAN
MKIISSSGRETTERLST